MRILHYIFGLPPVRGGGLIRYALDLAKEQKKQNNDVAIITPGRFSSRVEDRAIEKKNSISGVQIYQIINPIPIPMCNGIAEPELFLSDNNTEIYDVLFLKIKPDIIHIHSLLGLPEGLLIAAKNRKIRLVYTTHDYFGLCAKPDMVDFDGNICYRKEWTECNKCANNAFSLNRMKIEQSNLWRLCMGNSCFTKITDRLAILKKNYMEQKKESRAQLALDDDNVDVESYRKLQQQYLRMLDYIDFFHYNSSLTESVYKQFIGDKKGKAFPIMHSNIIDRRKKRAYSGKIKLGFLGGNTYYKGLDWLIETTEKCIKELDKIEIHIYGENAYGNKKYVVYHPNYKQNELENVFDSFDILIVPSLWNETFSFIVLEAISFGVPVICSEHVGAKDLVIESGGGYVYKSQNDYGVAINELINNKEKLYFWNSNILEYNYSFDFSSYVESVNKNIYKE